MKFKLAVFSEGLFLWFWFEFQLSSYYLPSLKQMLFDASRKLLVNAVPGFYHKACDLFFERRSFWWVVLKQCF